MRRWRFDGMGGVALGCHLRPRISLGSGVGTGLFVINDKLEISKHPASYVGTYTNRMVHWQSNQLLIGPYAIDAAGDVRTIEDLLEIRICSTMRHLHDPANKVYMFGNGGGKGGAGEGGNSTRWMCIRWKQVSSPISPKSLAFLTTNTPISKRHIATLVAWLSPTTATMNATSRGNEAAGRLAEWDGEQWTILERDPFIEVTGRGNFAGTIFAMGWDKRSAILQVFTEANGQWKRYRLPKASHTFDHMWQTEWPRIRELEHERFLMDCHGMFYELSPWAYDNHIWGIRPISTHLWVLGDFCAYRGMMVLGAGQCQPTRRRQSPRRRTTIRLVFRQDGRPLEFWQAVRLGWRLVGGCCRRWPGIGPLSDDRLRQKSLAPLQRQ